MEIKTNNVPRDLVALADIPESARSDFDYIEDEDAYSPRLFRYRGAWYDCHEFIRIAKRSGANTMAHTVDDDSPLLAWDGIETDTYFSATLVRYAVDECGRMDAERVIVGRCYS